MFLKACSNMGWLGEPIVRSWWIGCVCVVFVRDHSPDTIPPHGGQMLLKRG